MNPRLLALNIIQQVVVQGKSLNALSATINREIQANDDRALCRELVYGVVRWYEKLDYILSRQLSKPLKAKDSDVYCLLLLGIYQILYTRIPDHAAVNETVNLTNKLKKNWAKGLINGILRNLLRDKEIVLADPDDESARFSHPQWLIDLLKKDWPEEWEQILTANNVQARMSIRVNCRKYSRNELHEKLLRQGLDSVESKYAEHGLYLNQPVDPRRIKEFTEGGFSVQDEAAQLAAELLELEHGMAVLDACAAPGGKSTAILERGTDIALTALDVDESRLEKVRESLARLKLSARLTAADAAAIDSWWDGNPFDRILLDAPCSGTGVIRRNPDIKIHRQLEDVKRLVDNQRLLLRQLWSVLKPGGIMLYATCSVLKDENENQIANFVASHKDAEIVSKEFPWGRAVTFGRQILPGDDGMDGFYYAIIRKSGIE